MNFNMTLLSYLTVIAMLTAASIIDIRERRIPDRLIMLGAAAGMLFLLFDTQSELLNSLMGGITAGLVMLLLHSITKDGLGLGDVKLFGCTGIFLGLEGTVSAMVTAALLSGLYSLILICINRENKKREIPFAPFILAGALGAMFC